MSDTDIGGATTSRTSPGLIFVFAIRYGEASNHHFWLPIDFDFRFAGPFEQILEVLQIIVSRVAVPELAAGHSDNR